LRKEKSDMQVVLLEDVKSLGKKGQIVNVNDGYARNYILPKKLGVEANSRNLNDIKLKKAHEEKVAAAQLEEAKKLAEEIGEKQVVLQVKAGTDGRIFGSVSTKEIAKAAKEQLGLELDKKKMQLEDPIKMCGVTVVPVKLHRDVTAKLSVKVTEA
jgi:large subunit ribosomal protein L9